MFLKKCICGWKLLVILSIWKSHHCFGLCGTAASIFFHFAPSAPASSHSSLPSGPWISEELSRPAILHLSTRCRWSLTHHLTPTSTCSSVHIPKSPLPADTPVSHYLINPLVYITSSPALSLGQFVMLCTCVPAICTCFYSWSWSWSCCLISPTSVLPCCLLMTTLPALPLWICFLVCTAFLCLAVSLIILTLF